MCAKAIAPIHFRVLSDRETQSSESDEERPSLYDCRPCGFRSYAHGSGRFGSVRIAVCPCPRCGKRNRSSTLLLVTASFVACVMVGHGVSTATDFLETQLSRLLTISLGVLMCAVIVFAAVRVARRSGVRFYASGFRPAGDR